MKNKMFIYLVFAALALSVLNTSCQKTVDTSQDILALKASVTALQKRSDSLAAALLVTNTNLSTLSKSVDSIKTQLSSIIIQINQLNTQLTNVNANIVIINAQILILNQQYADLLAKLNAILAQLRVTPNTLSSGLLAWYPFSGNAIDSSGSGNDGSALNASLSQDRFGSPNSSYSFNGVNSSISVINKNLCTATTDVSISVWVKINAWTNNGGYKQATIIEQGPQNYYHLQVGPQTQADTTLSSINFQFNNRAYSSSINNKINLNQWYHIVFTLSNKMGSIYLNSKLVVQYAGYAYGNTPCASILNFGKESSFFYNGSIDELRIYNRALSQNEITYLASN
jgi:hypothetical protein